MVIEDAKAVFLPLLRICLGVISSENRADISAFFHLTLFHHITCPANDPITDQLVSPFAIDQIGWMAVGFGTKMLNSPMVITWPNSDGTITISQRQATEHVMPRVVPNPTDIATLAAGNTIVGSPSWRRCLRRLAAPLTFRVP